MAPKPVVKKIGGVTVKSAVYGENDYTLLKLRGENGEDSSQHPQGRTPASTRWSC